MPRRREYATNAERQQAYRLRQKHPAVHYIPASQAPGIYTFDLDALVASGQQFPCIDADPPWQYREQPPRGGAAKAYKDQKTMSVEELCALPIRELAAPKAHLHLWTTVAFRFEAKAVVEAWGFTLTTEWAWGKTTNDGRDIRMGAGHHLRLAHEILYVGTRGGLPPQKRNILSLLLAPRGAHSEKPDRMRDQIEQYSPGPRLELFGRTRVPGWTVWGNECHPSNGRLFQEVL